jgi:hypothetical protein
MNRSRLAALPLFALAALSLSACGKKDSVEAENESVESVAKKVAASDIKPLPGRWETSVTMGKIEMAGVPESAAQAMSQAGTQRGMATCLTPEDAAKMEDGSMFQQAPGDCKYDRFAMADGKIDGVMSCTQGVQKVNMTMSGTYTPNAYDLAMVTQTDMGGGRTMKMDMAVKSQRTGDCNGTELNTPKPPAK